MSLRNKFFSILTIALGIVVFSAFAMAQDTTAPNNAGRPDKGRGFGQGRAGHGGPEGRRGPGGDVMGMLRGLNLTDAQKTQIQSIMKSNRPDQATMETRRTLMEARKSGTLTTDQQNQLKAMRQADEAKMKATHEQVLNVLTSEQKAQIDARRKEIKERMQQRQEMRKKRFQDRQNQPKTSTTTDKPKTGTN